MKGLVDWIAATPLSVLFQQQEAWLIPTVQSIHIAGIGVVLACVLVMTLRILGYAATDLTVLQTQRRFGPWLIGALWVLLGTGILMIIAEPERELITFSFWAKMTLVAIGTAIALLFQRSVRARGEGWELSLQGRAPVKAIAVATLLIWLVIVVLGRLIAYDHVWGVLSPATKA